MLDQEPIKDESVEEEFHFLEERLVPPPLYKRIKWKRVLSWGAQVICVAGIVLGLLSVRQGLIHQPQEAKKQEEKEVTPQIITETTYQRIDMTPDSIDELSRDIQSFQEKVKENIVELKSIGEEETWYSNPDKYQLSAGILVKQNESHGFVLASSHLIVDKHQIQGSFATGQVYPFEVVSFDQELGIVLLSIDKSILDEDTRTLIEGLAPLQVLYPSLGSSVYAVGNPLGYPNTFVEGIVAGRFEMTETWDDRYQLLTLQMPLASNGSGLIMNVQGNIVGWIVPSPIQSKMNGYTNILTVRQMQEITQGLLLSKALPYLGLKVKAMEVKEQLDNEMPIGLYIENVAENSPALQAGIQPGDVITSINGNINLTQESFNELLLRDNSKESWDITAQRMTPKGYAEISLQVDLAQKKEKAEN